MHRTNTTQCHPVKIWASILEEGAEVQALNLASLPFIHRHVALMADAHQGKGSTVGAVIATKGAVIPAAVGVDIGCGMRAIDLGVPIDRFGGDARLRQFRDLVEAAIPVGFAVNEDSNIETTRGLRHHTWLKDHGWEQRVLAKAAHQLGTLGGGNHFIELCGDERNQAWVVIHSGSRYLGKHMADVHINEAQGLMKKYFIKLPDPDLAYLAESTSEFEAYIEAMNFAQSYAYDNRDTMAERALKCVKEHLGHSVLEPVEVIDCHHNYTTRENHFGVNVWVTRKGAVCARKGTKGIIPGSMGTRSYIVEGLGNADSFDSCAHGAGRRMSRMAARRAYTLKDLIAATEGVECRKDERVIDEIPMAYKQIDQVMADQVDLVRPLHTLKQVVRVKG